MAVHTCLYGQRVRTRMGVRPAVHAACVGMDARKVFASQLEGMHLRE